MKKFNQNKNKFIYQQCIPFDSLRFDSNRFRSMVNYENYECDSRQQSVSESTTSVDDYDLNIDEDQVDYIWTSLTP